MKEQYENYEKKLKDSGRPFSQKELKVIEQGKILCKNVQNPQVSTVWFSSLGT